MRERIVAAAARLIASAGKEAATTRAVAAAAGVQAPTIYRFFGDMQDLLHAAAEHGLAAYVAGKSRRKSNPDPVQALREGWDMHVAFGLANPALYSIMNGDPHPGPPSAAVAAGLHMLRQRIRAIAVTGRLTTSEERALMLVRSGCVGTVLTLLAEPEDRRDAGLSETAREAILAAIVGGAARPSHDGPGRSAAALRASLAETDTLTDGERHLLDELLGRISNGRRRA